MGQSGTIVHASCVAIDGRAVLITGQSGAGKSSLALQLIAMGAGLVADDRTVLVRKGDALLADVPPAIAGLIEAREVGILRLAQAGPTPVALCVDLDCTETARLPQLHQSETLDITLPCLHKSDSPHFAAAVLLYLKGERTSPS